ncbi:hypothetical protein BGX33_002661 [Mortierella sp. NVP41]|nr:hypothetical protein BGX33_002661 [Mortierella sp. NVP41]
MNKQQIDYLDKTKGPDISSQEWEALGSQVSIDGLEAAWFSAMNRLKNSIHQRCKEAYNRLKNLTRPDRGQLFKNAIENRKHANSLKSNILEEKQAVAILQTAEIVGPIRGGTTPIWVLETGTVVDDRLVQYANAVRNEDAAHSFVLDTSERAVMRHFTDVEQAEILRRKGSRPTTDKTVVDYLATFSALSMSQLRARLEVNDADLKPSDNTEDEITIRERRNQ